VENVPHAVAVRSVGLSMQMTQLKVLKVVTVSSGLACALTASSRCFCSTSCTVGLVSVRSIDSTCSPFSSSCLAFVAVPSSRFWRFADGPAVGDSLFRLWGGESSQRFTYPFDSLPGCGRERVVAGISDGGNGLAKGEYLPWSRPAGLRIFSKKPALYDTCAAGWASSRCQVKDGEGGCGGELWLSLMMACPGRNGGDSGRRAADSSRQQGGGGQVRCVPP